MPCFPRWGLLRFADRGQSIWVGRGRPSKRPALTLMQAAHLTATRAAKVAKKNAVPAMSSVLRFVPPKPMTRCDAALQQSQSR